MRQHDRAIAAIAGARNRMIVAAAALAGAILATLGAIHIYWASGGSAGKAAAIPTIGGKPTLKPGAATTALVGLALVAMAALVAASAGMFPTPFSRSALRILTALLAVVFLARAIGDFRLVGFFKRASDSRFARLDTRLYSPLCLVLAALICVVAAD